MKNNTASRPFGIRDKISYMMGDVGCNMVLTLANSYLLVFYTKVMGVSAALVGTMFMLVKFVDAVTDMAVGRVVDTHTFKNGDRFRPWLAYASVPMVICSCAMYNFFLADAAMWVKVVWLIVTYLLFGSVFYTAVNIPYGAMSAVISEDSGHRSSLSTWRQIGSQLGGVILGVIIPLIVYTKDANGNSVASGPRFFMAAVVLGIIALLCIFICYKGSVERIHITNKAKTEDQQSMWVVIRHCLKDRAIMTNMLNTVCVYVIIQLYMTFNQYLFLDYFQNVDLSGMASIVMFAGTVLAAAVATPVSKKYGKKELALVGGALSAAGYAVTFVLRSHSPYVYFIEMFVVFFTLSLGAMLCYAFLSDCVDDHYLRTGERADGTIYAFNSFIRKLAGALCSGIGGWSLTLIGYNELAAVQTETVQNSLFTIAVGLPTVFAVLAFIAMYFYPLSKKKVEENTQKLAAFRQSEEKENVE